MTEPLHHRNALRILRQLVLLFALTAWMLYFGSRGTWTLWVFNPSGIVLGLVDGSVWFAHEAWDEANLTAHSLGRIAERELEERGRTYSLHLTWRSAADCNPFQGHDLFVAIPLWMIGLLGVLTFLGLRRRGVCRKGRAKTPTCHCGYDLTGNTSGRCPECGHTVTNGETRP